MTTDPHTEKSLQPVGELDKVTLEDEVLKFQTKEGNAMTQFKNSPEQARKLWVEALRSGKYEQGRSYLRKGDKYCCLGIVCELFLEHEPGLLTTAVKGSTLLLEGELTSSLPAVVRGWLAIRDAYGGYQTSTLASENDNGATFADIATLIESSPPGLFVEAAQ